MSLLRTVAVLIPGIRRLRESRNHLRAERDALMAERIGLMAKLDGLSATRAQRGEIAYTSACGKIAEKLFERSDIRHLDGDELFISPVYEAKRFKILGQYFFPETNVLIWMDANIRMKIGAAQAVDKFLGDSDLALFRHPTRDCIYEEFKGLPN